MRWKYNPPKETAIGSKRFKRSFLLIPRVIDKRWVWLERVLVEYTYEVVSVYVDYGSYPEKQWVKTKVSLID
jgi:hypothetical protein